MPRTALAVQKVTRSPGLSPTYSAANVDGHALAFGTGRFLHVKNSGASPVTVTPVITRGVDGVVPTALGVSVAASGERMIGPFTSDYKQAVGDEVWVNFSAVTSVTCAHLEV